MSKNTPSAGKGLNPTIVNDEFRSGWDIAYGPRCDKHPDQPMLKCEKCREEHWDNYNEKRGPYSETTSD